MYYYCLPSFLNSKMLKKMTAKNFKIENKLIKSGDVFIIAEGGVNHNGRLDLALKLIDAASEAGADAIKFQTWRAEQLVTKSGEMADYQKRNLGKVDSQYNMLKKLELKEDWYPKLVEYAKTKKIILLSTPHGGFESVDLMNQFNFPAFKFGSGDLNNLPLLKYAAKFKKPMLISTGMSNQKEVEDAVNVVRDAGNSKILVFQCSTDYPLDLEDVNLNVLKTFEKKLAVLVGYSDHTLGEQVSIMAVTLGACVVEKHLTLNRKMKGPDHIASMEPDEFKLFVDKLRLIPMILGSSIKNPQKKELQYLNLARKSVVTKRSIKKGEKFTLENLTIKRPGSGIKPKEFFKILGKRAAKNIAEDLLLTRKMIV